MEARPKLQIPITGFDKVLEVLGAFILILPIIYVFLNFSKLPEVIPTHYDFTGKADAFGSKKTILALPIIALIIYGSITFLSRYPHRFNYLTKITNENAYNQYSLAVRMIRYLKIFVALILGYIGIRTVQIALSNEGGLHQSFLFLCLGSIGVIMLYSYYQSLKEK